MVWLGGTEDGGPVANAELYQQAKAFAESISKGDVKAKHGETDKKDSSHF